MITKEPKKWTGVYKNGSVRKIDLSEYLTRNIDAYPVTKDVQDFMKALRMDKN